MAGRTLNSASLNEALKASFPNQKKRDMAIGIIMAESGGREDARNVNTDGSIDRGIFQINSRAHPEVSDQCAYSASCAARAARVISLNGTNWKPWCTAWSDNACGKNGGTYLGEGAAVLKYVGKGNANPANADSGFLGTGIGSPSGIKVPNPIEPIAKLANAVETFVSGLFSADTWFRVGKVVLGLVLLIFGIVNLMPASLKQGAMKATAAAAIL